MRKTLFFCFMMIFAGNTVLFSAEQIYKVWIWQETGDSLWNIAKKFYGDGRKWTIIYEANRDKIKDPRKIFPKQELIIPSSEEISIEQNTTEIPSQTQEESIEPVTEENTGGVEVTQEDASTPEPEKETQAEE